MIDANLSSEQLIDLILTRCDGLVPQKAWGEVSLFYNSDLKFASGTYFATIKEKNGENDQASNPKLQLNFLPLTIENRRLSK